METLKHLRDLILETAVCQLAVDDFEPVEGENNDEALSHAMMELDAIKLSLLNYVLKEGEMLRLKILAEQISRRRDVQTAAPVREGLWRTPFTR